MMLSSARLLLASAVMALSTMQATAGSFPYRASCPKPGTLFDTEAYFCATMGYKDLGKRVEAAYQGQLAHLREVYDKPDDADKLAQEQAVLEASQKGWERYAANQCAAEGYMAWGGTLEPQLVGDCTQRLAEARIKELEMLLEGLGN